MSAYPPSLNQLVARLLKEAGDNTPIQSAQSLGGGCINHALRLKTEANDYLLKWNSDPLPGMFAAEVRGLELLAATHTVRVPMVYGSAEAASGQPALILLEWLEGSDGDPSALGEQLARLHQAEPLPGTPLAYGLDGDNYLGSSVQKNAWDEDWVHFFGEFRLRPQMELARQNHRLPPERQKRLESLITHLDEILCGVERQPALIHGDLWGGNVIPGPDGLALIDPAVSYSDREAEIAYTQLFGGFSPSFYGGYQSVWPLEAGFSDRRDLYNLYHLLNHLNIFGEGYGDRVDAVLRRYTR